MFFSKNKTPFNKDFFTKKNLLQSLKKIIFGATTTRKMFRLYFLILILFSCLLFLPISFNANYEFHNSHYYINIPEFDIKQMTWTYREIKINFFDVLFTAFSAFSDTGLIVAPTYSTFSTFGKIILMFLIQIGGFGIMFFIFLVWKLFMRKDKLSINQMLMAQAEKGTTKIGQTSKMLISTSLTIIVLEIIFGIFYSLWFMYVPAYNQSVTQSGFNIDTNTYIDLYNNSSKAFFAGFFHSVSSINNAGFDIIGMFSLAPYKNGVHTVFLFFTAIQFIIGGIGFPVLYDIFKRYRFIWINKKFFKAHDKWKKIILFKIKKNNEHRVSLFTKIVIWSTIFMIIFSLIIWFLFETTSLGSGNNLLWKEKEAFDQGTIGYYNKSVQIIFQALSTRSAGFSTINCSNLNQATKWFSSFLMFVGAAPSSTAGGIRLTTFAICIFSVYSRLIGRDKVSAFHRSINNDDIRQAFVVLFVAIFAISLGGVIIATTINQNGEYVFTSAIFESASAFGTAGLTTIGRYSDINWVGKLYLMFLMFIGQLGISSTLLALNRRIIKKNRYNYIEEKIRLG